MADISKCYNSEQCPLKDSCYRHIAPADEHWQLYCNFYEDEENCTFYWPTKDLSKANTAS